MNDKPIILTSSLKKDKDYPVYLFKNTTINELVHKLKFEKLNGVYLFCNDLLNDWLEIKANFNISIAAGGLVLNKEHHILFIYRGNKWDLPKGRREIGETIEETAIREVREECGITHLIIKEKLIVTHHIFFLKGAYHLKEIHWYLMSTNFSKKPVPQLEEGIKKATFLNKKETEASLLNSFANIKLVYNKYLSTIKNDNLSQ